MPLLPIALPAPRLAQFEDLAAIVAIYNETIPSREVTADLDAVTVASRLAWFAEHTPVRRPIWVVEVEGQIAGWMSFSDFHPRPAYAHTAEISIYLRTDMRGKGLGSAFLRFAIASAPQLEVHSLVGLIFGHNHSSLKLFDAFGFQHWGMLPRVALLDQTERDLLIVGKRISK